jgi:hypothetical protein
VLVCCCGHVKLYGCCNVAVGMLSCMGVVMLLWAC